ncbi:hypothetical protein [Actinokineospora sp.]|uniref:hypothetical protein n=1 Tax=Actinokineospora sp. TaxID=1872133 RepID=UPI00403821EE
MPPRDASGQTPGTRTYEGTVDAELREQALERARQGQGGTVFHTARELGQADKAADQYSNQQQQPCA